MIHVYTGDGKGKTTSACGIALRAAGRRKRVLFVQFLKGSDLSGEILSMKRIPYIEIKRFGRDGFVRKDKIRDADLREISQGMKFVESRVKDRNIDVIILDEINLAMNYGLIDVKRILALIKKYRKEKEIILTGREAPASILKKADYVTFMKSIKHPYEKGVRARRGIEY